MRRAHRWLGLSLVLPFVLWTVTGLLFLVKPGWRGAYEGLSAFRDEPLDAASLVPLAVVVASAGSAVRVELGATALGPLYVVTGADGASVHDARTGTRISPLGRAAARMLALDAVARANASHRYGESNVTREMDGRVELDFEGGTTVAVDRDDASISQRGADTDRIDALYRIHYVQWTGIAAIDRPLAILAIVATWALAGLGVALFRRPRID